MSAAQLSQSPAQRRLPIGPPPGTPPTRTVVQGRSPIGPPPGPRPIRAVVQPVSQPVVAPSPPQKKNTLKHVVGHGQAMLTTGVGHLKTGATHAVNFVTGLFKKKSATQQPVGGRRTRKRKRVKRRHKRTKHRRSKHRRTKHRRRRSKRRQTRHRRRR